MIRSLALQVQPQESVFQMAFPDIGTPEVSFSYVCPEHVKSIERQTGSETDMANHP